ncbi:MAG: hypothetical protein AAF581_01955 [Planctomycetota bacterium]
MKTTVSDDPGHACQRICDLVGVNAPASGVLLCRTNPYPLRDIIENAPQVEAALDGTRFDGTLDS